MHLVVGSIRRTLPASSFLHFFYLLSGRTESECITAACGTRSMDSIGEIWGICCAGEEDVVVDIYTSLYLIITSLFVTFCTPSPSLYNMVSRVTHLSPDDLSPSFAAILQYASNTSLQNILLVCACFPVSPSIKPDTTSSSAHPHSSPSSSLLLIYRLLFSTVM